MRIILDTNSLLVSISARSRYYPIFKALKEKRYELVVTTDILLEYEEVISQHMGEELADDVLILLGRATNVICITRYFNWQLIKADPDDDKFVDAAVAGNVDFIVSEDQHFRILKNIPFPAVKVMKTGVFLTLLLNITEADH